MAIIVGYDNGMGNNKIVYKDNSGKEKKIDFPSRVKKLDTDDSTDALFINGDAYSFTEGRLVVQNGFMSKDNEESRLLLYKGLYDVYEATGETHFNISMNCSLDSYKDDKGAAVKKFMTSKNVIKVKEQFKNEVELTIDNLVVLPENLSGGVLANVKLKENDVVMIDIGTRNLSIIQVQQGSPQYHTSFATKYGMNHIYNGIADMLKIHVKGLGSANAVKLYLMKTSEGEAPIQKADDIILKYLIENVFTELDERLEDLELNMYTKFIFLGGGSALLQRFLDSKFTDREKVYVKDSYYANAIGLMKKAERLFGATPTKVKK